MDSWFGYLFQATVLLQPLFWMWLYDTKIKFPENLKFIFYLAGLFAFAGVFYTGFEIGFYKSHLLLQYISMTLITFQIYNIRYNTQQALSLAFLTVFLNSFYWETPLHVAAWLSGESISNILLQVWRLFPLAFFIKRYELKRSQRVPIELGLIYSFTTMILALYIIPRYRIPLYALNRVICLFILTKTITEAEPKNA